MSVEYLIGIVFNNSNILTDSAHVHSQDFCEIVSIAWCLIDLVSQKILSLDQSSICPLNIHDLGDRWDHINSAPPLDDFLLELESKYVNLIGSLDQACIITDGPIPLRQTLHPEALRKNIPLNKLFFSYFDLQKEFSKAYNKSHIPGAYTLPRILRNLALSTDYVLQNNIEDAKMFSKVVLALLQIGHKFTEPQTISVSYNENQFPQLKYLQDDHVLKIRGMPYESTHFDIYKFFSGLNICSGGILILLSKKGQKTGEALILFEDQENCQLAFRRNKWHMASRYIEILQANVGIFKIIEKRFSPDRSKYLFGSVARLRGLPFRCSEESISEFICQKSHIFGESKGVLIVENENCLPSGDAFVLFQFENDLEKAMALDRTNLDDRYIEIFRSNIGELLQIACRQHIPSSFARILGFSSKNNFRKLNNFDSSRISTDHIVENPSFREDCVRLRGLPFSATVDDILDFFCRFSDEILPRGIHFVFNQSGKPTGECYVQMSSYGSAQCAAKYLHKRYLESRYIEVYVSSNLQLQGKSSTMGGMDAPYSGYLQNRKDSYRRSYSPSLINRREEKRFRVKLRGLPFTADKREIAVFFYAYGIEESDVVFLDEGSRRTGEAFVYFPSRDRARRAVREKHKQYIGDRYIELFEAF